MPVLKAIKDAMCYLAGVEYQPQSTCNTTEDRAREVNERFTAAATLTFKRCTFLGGYAYNEFSRWSTSRGNDCLYLGLVSSLFACSVVSNVIAGYLLFYLKSVTRPDCQLELCKRLDWAVQLMYRVFLVGCFLYLSALARAGWNYFPSDNAKWLPCGTALVCITIGLVCLCVIGWKQGVILEGCDDYYTMPEEKSVTTENTPQNFVEEGYQNTAFSEELQSRISRGDPLSERCMLIPYFAGYALTRYITTPRHETPDEWRVAFIIGSSLGSCLPMLGCIVLTSDLLFCMRLCNASHQKQWLEANWASYIWTVGKWCYYVGVFGFYVCMATVGYGTDFAIARLSPVYISLWALLLVLAVLMYSGGALLLVRKREKDGELDTEDEKSDLLTVEVIENEFDSTAKAMGWVSIFGIVTSGYVFYAICAAGAQLEELVETHSITHQHFVNYINTNAMSFTLCLTTAVVPTIYMVVNTRNPAYKAKLGKYLRPVAFVASWLYRCAIVVLLVAFGSFGTLKFGTAHRTFINLGFAWCAAAIIAVGEVYGWWVAWRVRKGKLHAPTGVVIDGGLNFDGITLASGSFTNLLNNASYSESMTQKLDVTARRALFFGGISYFSADFINPKTIGEADGKIFLTFISTTFTLAMVVISFNVSFRLKIFTTWAKPQKDLFAFGARYLVFSAMALFLIAALSFFLGVAWLGRVKTYVLTTQEDAHGYGIFFMVMGFVAVFGVILLAFYLPPMAALARKKQSLLPHNFPRIPNLSFPVETMLGEIGSCAMCAAFVAGNVFYELLLCEARGQPWAVYMYWTFCFITLWFGGWVIVTMVYFMICLSSLGTERSKQQFCRVCYDKLKLAQFVFVLFNMMWYGWLAAVSLIGWARHFVVTKDIVLPDGKTVTVVVQDCMWIPTVPAVLGIIVAGTVWVLVRRTWLKQYDTQAFNASKIEFMPSQYITPPKSWQCL